MADAPVFNDYSLEALVIKADPDHYKRDKVYEFSNGREFEEDPTKGVYEP